MPDANLGRSAEGDVGVGVDVDVDVDVEVVVIGAGLAGLHAARLLQQHAVDFVLLEAQPHIGGRIFSASTPDGGRYDLGPTWFWPAAQPRMPALLRELGLRTFEQPIDGGFVYEVSPTRVERMPAGIGTAGSMRLQGGMQALVDALAADLAPDRLHCGQRVLTLRRQGERVAVDSQCSDGSRVTLRARQVIATLPPRLLVSNIAFEPGLPQALVDDWSAVPTWMAPHAKFVAVYDHAFWRDAGCSGHAQSRVGPLVEIHDASSPGGLPALFGFVGVPAQVRQRDPDALQRAALAQLGRLFGTAALAPLHCFYKDWSEDSCVATPADMQAPSAHPAYGRQRPLPAVWSERLAMAGTEVAPEHGGLLEGALEASELAVTRLLRMRGVASSRS